MTPPPTARFLVNPAALPVMPELARRLLDSLGRDDLGFDTLARLIERDPALAAKLLRLANSPRYRPQPTLTRLQDAAATLGLAELRGLALAACLVNVFPRPLGFDRHRFWCLSLATAGHARQLAGLLSMDAEAAATAGLVLRAGLLLMLLTDPGVAALVDSAAVAPDTLFELQREHLGCTHAEVTAELAARWHFAPVLVEALAAASDPLGRLPFSPAGAVLRLASVLAEAGHDGHPLVPALQQAQPALLEHLGLAPAVLSSRLQPHAQLTAAVAELLQP